MHFALTVLIISVTGLVIWRCVVPFSDWLVRVFGVVSLRSIFTAEFSAVKMLSERNEHLLS